MSAPAALLAELERETRTTRRHLERIPAGRFDWRPHPKSTPAGALASHVVSCLRFVEPIVMQDALDFDPATHRPFQAGDPAALLAGFDETVARAAGALRALTGPALDDPWQFRIRGALRFEKARGEALRDMAFSHLVHHRGQLSVYLRLMDVPVPATYGPTADEAPG
ncbi:MAG: DinB family protein [Vicinamibacteria bacterium]